MKRVVITGGPCAGKTTVLAALTREFGKKIQVVPEAATAVLAGGFPKKSQFEDSNLWSEAFQKAVFALQMQMETIHALVGASVGAKVLVCDRGLVDSAAYLEGGEGDFLRLFGFHPSNYFDRYDLVIHLESTAVCAPSLYSTEGNAQRYEDLETAVKVDEAVRGAWLSHPNWIEVEGKNGIAEVINTVIGLVSSYLDTEFERKYVLQGLPSGLDKGVVIEQGYLITDQGEMRLRKVGEQTFIGIKSDGGFARGQWEKTLPKEFFDMLWPQTEGKRVKKTRYTKTENGLTWEIDLYHGDLITLITAECEVGDENGLDGFDLPGWITDASDVTEDEAFKNKNLAVHGLPDSVRPSFLPS